MKKLALLLAFMIFFTFNTTQAGTSSKILVISSEPQEAESAENPTKKSLSKKELECYYQLYKKLKNAVDSKDTIAMSTITILLKMEGLPSCDILKYLKNEIVIF